MYIFTHTRREHKKQIKYINKQTYTTYNGVWHTDSGKKFKVNLDQDLIEYERRGICFCWFKDNPGINDENNETFYETEEDDGEKIRVLREGITVTVENGQVHPLSGYVSHWVENKMVKLQVLILKSGLSFNQNIFYQLHYFKRK